MMEYDREIDDLKALVTKALEKKGVLSKIRVSPVLTKCTRDSSQPSRCEALGMEL
jgi:hypothetical protein